MSSTDDGSQPSDRRQRLEALQKQQRSGERRREGAIWGLAAIVIVAIAIAVTFSVLRERANTPTLTAVQSFDVQQGHVETPVTYAQNPPAGGEHAPVWLNCGVYAEPVPNENAVHAMEHGAVWVTYRPDLPSADVAALRQTLPGTYTVLSPYEGLPAPVVVSAWGKQLRLDGARDPRLTAFVTAYRQGPQTPEPGATCSGGLDPQIAS